MCHLASPIYLSKSTISSEVFKYFTQIWGHQFSVFFFFFSHKTFFKYTVSALNLGCFFCFFEDIAEMFCNWVCGKVIVDCNTLESRDWFLVLKVVVNLQMSLHNYLYLSENTFSIISYVKLFKHCIPELEIPHFCGMHNIFLCTQS